MFPRTLLLAVTLGACAPLAIAQQVPDRAFTPSIDAPAYSSGRGPVVCVDEGHANFHTLDERFWAFGELLRRDGFMVRPISDKFDARSLHQCAIIVVSNAQPGREPWDQYPSPTPSAFATEEVDATRQWVRAGGNLLLIADHMPLAGAAASLAAAFGVTFTDGFAVEDFADEAQRAVTMAKPTLFRTTDGTLSRHRIVSGRYPEESVTVVRSFTGQAFRAPAAEPLMILPANFVLLMPRIAWQFGPETPKIASGGWLQGAVMRVESGRAAFFGEAAMFTAQVTGPERRPMGMNAPGAEQNAQFVLNVMHWLAGLLE
jgi:hypothetical protein